MARYVRSKRGPWALAREHAAETAEDRAARMAAIVRANLATIDRLESAGRVSADDAAAMRAAEHARAEVQ